MALLSGYPVMAIFGHVVILHNLFLEVKVNKAGVIKEDLFYFIKH